MAMLVMWVLICLNVMLIYLNPTGFLSCACNVHIMCLQVVFWHHRVGHSASKNRSNVIRQAVLYDFRHKKLEEEV